MISFCLIWFMRSFCIFLFEEEGKGWEGEEVGVSMHPHSLLNTVQVRIHCVLVRTPVCEKLAAGKQNI